MDGVDILQAVQQAGHRFNRKVLEREVVPSMGRLATPLIRPPENCENRKPHPFAYSPLPTPTSVRLIEIKPISVHSEFDAYLPIECNLIVVDLNDLPVYDALSYTWGCPVSVYWEPRDMSSPAAWSAPAFTITCNGRPFSVTTNLYAALLNLRLRISGVLDDLKSKPMPTYARLALETAPYIWIDQVCINQADLQERSAQIMIMQRVYQQAKKVSIWLGGVDRFTHGAIVALHKLALMPREKAVNASRGISLLAPNANGDADISIWNWMALYALLSRSWFRRAWVIQEAALGERLTWCCGTYEFPFEELSAAMTTLKLSRWINELIILARSVTGSCGFSTNVGKGQIDEPWIYISSPDDEPDPQAFYSMVTLRSYIVTFHRDRQQVGNPDLNRYNFGMGELTIMFYLAKATDPRDKVYAFLGLAEVLSTRRLLDLVPDYTTPVERLYRECTWHILSSNHNLNYLCTKEDQSDTKLFGLPSWVPDYSISRSDTGLYGEMVLKSPWSASSHMGPCHMVHHASGMLEVHGARMSKVHRLCKFPGLLEFGLDGSPADLRSFLTAIPEISSFRVPHMTQNLQLYLTESFSEQEGIDIPSSARIENEGATISQRRLEVFWRTLVMDIFDSQYPAPAATLDLFRRAIDAVLFTVIIFASTNSDPSSFTTNFVGQDKIPGFYDLASLKRSIRTMYGLKLLFSSHLEGDFDDGKLPDELSYLLPKLDAAWAHGTVCTEGLSYAMGSWVFGETIATPVAQIEVHRLNNQIKRNCTRRLLFVTTDGQLGIGPKSIQPGDEAWWLAGADTPYILRPLKDETYLLVGQAYVHGAMFGDATGGASGPDMETILIA